MNLGIFEVDYTLNDVAKYKASPKALPQYVVAENVSEAVKRAKEFEDENVTLLKCNLSNLAKVSIQKKVKGLEPNKETA